MPGHDPADAAAANRPGNGGSGGRSSQRNFVRDGLAPLAAEEDHLHGLQDDVHVGHERHVLDVVEVGLQLSPRFLDAGGVELHHLRPAGDARLDHESLGVERNLLLELPHEGLALGSRPDQAHFSAQDVDQLRQFIDAEPPQPPARASDPGVILHRPDGTGLALCVGSHRAELQDREGDAVATQPLLAVENGSAGIEPDPQGGDRPEGSRQYQPGERSGDVERALAPANVGPGRVHRGGEEPLVVDVRHGNLLGQFLVEGHVVGKGHAAVPERAQAPQERGIDVAGCRDDQLVDPVKSDQSRQGGVRAENGVAPDERPDDSGLTPAVDQAQHAQACVRMPINQVERPPGLAVRANDDAPAGHEAEPPDQPVQHARREDREERQHGEDGQDAAGDRPGGSGPKERRGQEGPAEHRDARGRQESPRSVRSPGVIESGSPEDDPEDPPGSRQGRPVRRQAFDSVAPSQP